MVRLSTRVAVAAAVLTGLFATTFPASAQEATSATAKLEPGLIGVGQTATLTLEAQSSGLKDLRLDPQFSLSNLEIVSGPMQSQSWQFVNGRASRAESLIWRLRAKSVGTATVTAISLKVNDATFELPDQTLEVQQEPVGRPDPSGRRRFLDPFENSPFSSRSRPQGAGVEPELFLRAEASPKRPYVGQQVLYTLYLFTQADVGAINPETVPGFEGFWVEDVPQPERLQPDMVEVQGKRYGRVVLLRKAVFPRQAGPVEFEPVRARLIASIPEYNWLGSVIDRRRELVRTSNAVTIDVKPLPEAPADFAGAVGKLDLSAQLEPAELRLGEAATLTVTLEGVGNIQGLLEPELPVLEGVRVFPPEQSSRNEISGTRVRGTKSWKYVLVPDQPGKWEIPPLAIRYFDPFAEEFRAAEAEPAVLTALAPLDSIPSVALSEAPQGVTEEGAGSEDVSKSVPWFRRPWLVGGSVAVVIGLLLAPVAARLRGRSESRRLLSERLRQVSAIPQARRAADALEEAWSDFLEDRYEIDSDAPPRQWPRKLREQGLGPSRVAEIGRIAEDIDYLRSAPELSASEALIAELVARSLKLARGLR